MFRFVILYNVKIWNIVIFRFGMDDALEEEKT